MNNLIRIGIEHIKYFFKKISLYEELNENQRIALELGVCILQCKRISKVNMIRIIASCYSIEDDDVNNAIVILKEIVELMTLLKINEIEIGG